MAIISLPCKASSSDFEYFEGIPVQLHVNTLEECEPAKKKLDSVGAKIESIHLRRATRQNQYLLDLIKHSHAVFGAKRYTLHPGKEDADTVNRFFAATAYGLAGEGVQLSFENQKTTGVWLRNPYKIREVRNCFWLTLDTGHVQNPEQAFNDLQERILIVHLSGPKHTNYLPSNGTLGRMLTSAQEIVLEFGSDKEKKTLRRGLEIIAHELASQSAPEALQEIQQSQSLCSPEHKPSLSHY